MIKITVNLFAGLKKYTGFENRKGNEIDVGNETNIKEFLEILNIPAERVSLIMVNGKYQEKEYGLEAGDNVSLFPPIGGG